MKIFNYYKRYISLGLLLFLFSSVVSQAAAPTVTSVSPNNGPITGGTNVTVGGSNFAAQYRKPITITNSGVSLIDFQLMITLDTQSLISASKMQSDCDDMRFYDSDGNTLLNYFMESGCNSTVTKIWVKIPSLPVGNKIIYFQYGDFGATTASNCDNTFVFCDEFNGTSVNISKWNIVDGTGFSVGIDSVGKLKGTNNTGRLTSIATFSEGNILETKFYIFSVNTSGGFAPAGFWTSSANGVGFMRRSGCELRNDSVWSACGGSANLPTNRDVLIKIDAKSTSLVDLYIYEYNNNNLNLLRAVSDQSNQVSQEPIALGRRYDDALTGYSYVNEWDWIRVRKSVSSVPTSVIGSEELLYPRISFGGTLATNVVFINSTTLTGTTPAHTAGAVNVDVINFDGQSGILTSGYTYNSPPTVTSVTPGNGVLSGGNSVTIAGTGFVFTPAVTFGGISATGVVWNSGTSLTAVTPAGASPGLVNVVVTNPDSQSGTLSNAFNYIGTSPTVTSVTPNSGLSSGGTAVTVSGNSFLTYPYRKPITITNSGLALTDFQILVTLADTWSLISASKMQPDCDDIVFYDPGGGTFLNYWIESGCNTISAKIWVKVPSIPNGNKTIYMGYGNSLAVAASNGDGVFNFFDDFPGTSLNTTKWDSGVVGGSISVTGGQLHLDYNFGVAGFAAWVKAKMSPGTGLVQEARLGVIRGNTTSANWGFMFYNRAWKGTVYSVDNKYYGNTCQPLCRDVALGVNDSSLHRFKFVATGARSKIYFDDVLKEDDGNVYSVFPFLGNDDTVTNNSAELWADWVFVRKYAASEPTTSVGTEESVSVNPQITFDGVLATGVTYVNFTTLNAITPVHAAGLVNVSVTNPGGQSGILNNGFSYISATPIVTSVTPNSGLLSGGTAVTINGSNFLTQLRKPITITNGGSALTNFQTLVTLDTQSLISASKMQSDCDDMRFYDSDGFTALSYFLESGCNTSATKAWVKIPSLFVGSKTIYIQYGDLGVASISSCPNTFTFCDEFNGTSIDISKWNIVDSTGWSVVGGELRGSDTTGRLQSLTTFGEGNILETKSRYVGLPTNGYMMSGFRLTDVNNVGFLNHLTTTYYINNGLYFSVGSQLPISTNLFTKITTRLADRVDIKVTNFDTGATYQDIPDLINTVSGEPIALGRRYFDCCYPQTYEAYWDWIRVRKYAATEPSLGIGAEELAQPRATFGGVPATGVTFVSAISLNATTPAHAVGAVDVVVYNPDQQSGTLTGGFTYVYLSPTIGSVSPNLGYTTGGNQVTITGTNFLTGPNPTVTFGGVAATGVTYNSQTSLTATVPSWASPATVNVVVKNFDNQEVTLTGGYTYEYPAPQITNLSPGFGSLVGGETIIITGQNFVDLPGVTFGGILATTVTFISPTSLSVVTPPGLTFGLVDVTVTNPDTKAGTLSKGYWYDPGNGGTTNISSQDKWAWNERVGWINFYTSGNVNVFSTRLEGYAYNPEIGYIALNCNSTPNGNICDVRDFKVTNDGSGNLTGWAWNDIIGWISFNCNNSELVDPCGTGNNLYPYQVRLSTNAQDNGSDFFGWAWNDVVGWISFSCINTNTCATSNYKVSTSWKANAIVGKLTSPIFDSLVPSTLNSVIWKGDLPNGTSIKFQFASANDPAGPWDFKGPDGTINSFYQSAGSGSTIVVNKAYHNNYRYFRYQIIMSSDFLQTVAPRIDDIIINYSP